MGCCVLRWICERKDSHDGCVNGKIVIIEMYDHREDLTNILVDHKNAIVRGIIPFSLTYFFYNSNCLHILSSKMNYKLANFIMDERA